MPESAFASTFNTRLVGFDASFSVKWFLSRASSELWIPFLAFRGSTLLPTQSLLLAASKPALSHAIYTKHSSSS